MISASGSAQRKLLDDQIKKLGSEGYEDVRKIEAQDWSSLLSENMGGGIFAERSIVIVEEADKLGEMPQNCASMLEPEGSPVEIIAVCRPKSSRAKAEDDESEEEDRAGGGIPIPKQLLSKCKVVKSKAPPPPWSRERDAIIASAAKDRGVRISSDALDLLKERFDDVEELASEAGKLAEFCSLRGKKEITVDDVLSMCLPDGERDALKFVDALCGGDAASVLPTLSAIESHEELIKILAMLYNRSRIAYFLAAYPTDGEIFAQAFGSGDYAVKHARRASSRFGKAPLLSFQLALFEISYNERSGSGAGWKDLAAAVITLLTS